MTRRNRGLVVALALLALAACKKKDAPDPIDNSDDVGAIGEDGVDTATAESDTELLISSLISPSVSSGSLSLSSAEDLELGGAQTADVGDGAKAFFFPRGCLTTSYDQPSSTITYTFAKCSGPNGLYRATGEVKARFVSEAKTLTLDITGTGLTLNRATADWHATAVITATGPLARTMTWKASLAGKTARDREFTRTIDKTISWRVGEKCFTLNGMSEGDIRRRNLRTEIVAFTRCQGACPEAGGKIALTNLNSGKRVEIAFDGTANATIVAPNGTSSALPLLCTP